MKSQYAQAFLKSLDSGLSIDAAISGLTATLRKNRHSKLLGAVLLEAVRTLETSSHGRDATVSVASSDDAKARKTDIKAALMKLGASDQTVIKETVDPTLIGGFVATYNYQEHDASYKKSLKNLYESIIK